MNHYESSEHPVPGMKYRPEIRTRMVETTIGGKTRLTSEQYTVQVMVHPVDWDRAIMRGVMGVTLGATALTVSWTMASVGGLLARHVPDAIGYGVATVLDAGWLACVGLEWVERRDPERARPAMFGGWIALALSMGAMITDGLTMTESWGAAVGAIGAVIALSTKGLWWLVKRRFQVPLSGNAAQFLRDERQDIAARRAVAADLAQYAREQAYTRAVYGEAADELSVTVTRPAHAPLAVEPVPAVQALTGQQNAVFGTVQPVFQNVQAPVQPTVPAPAANTSNQQEHGQNTVFGTVPPVFQQATGLVPVPASGLIPPLVPAPTVYANAPEQPAVEQPAPPAAPAAPAPGPDNSMAEVVRYALTYDVGGPFDADNAEVMTRVRAIVTARIQSSHPGRTYKDEVIHASVNRELRKAKMRKTA
ncbi:hypothetical protein ACFY0G_02115 [Streptomyces sp. NPDC001552]|uniref:hypothetical protein n=1 Tax=Streptomyces sp. NPDC001552 TaxID=3364587 RepID=UPI0036949155